MESAPLAYRKMKPGYEALGLVLDFLARSSPFDSYRTCTLLAVIKYQLANDCHITAVKGDALVGYAGWFFVTEQMGEAWLKGELKDLRPVPASESTAAALNIVKADSRPAVTGLIRCCRQIGAGRRIFFKRDYAPGAERRNTVLNVTAPRP